VTGFEQLLADTALTINIDAREARLADEHGVTIAPGAHVLTWDEGKSIVQKLDAAMRGGVQYKSIRNRLRSLRNQIVTAFGPDAIDEVGLQH